MPNLLLVVSRLLHVQLTCCRHLCTFPTSTTLNQMLINSINSGRHLHSALTLFHLNPLSRNLNSWNIIIGGCLKYHHIQLAHQLFDDMPQRDIVSWNIWLSHLHHSKDQHHHIYHSFLHLQRCGLRPNSYTFSIVISSFLGCVFISLILQLHAQIVHLGYCSSAFVGSALMRGYTNLGNHSALCSVFHDILEKNVTVWNALVSGYMDLGLTHEAHKAFDRMPEKNVVSWTSMVDGYMKNKQVNKAYYIFNRMGEKNAITWTAMISGHVNMGKFLDALSLFVSMMRTGTRPNQHTFASTLTACARHSELLAGMQLHASIVKHGTPLDDTLSTALVDMYAKCGDIESAHSIFETTCCKTLASWNSIIGAHARHGLSRRAVGEFERMIRSGVRPNHITFINVLSACSYGGLIEEGEKIFSSMERLYSVSPIKEHYACMVDLYGRAGDLEKAKHLIEHMPLKPDVVVWGALLGACGVHSDFEFSNNAAEAVKRLEMDHPIAYSMLAKILGEKGVWSSLSELKTSVMDKSRKRRQKAGSWIA